MKTTQQLIDLIDLKPIHELKYEGHSVTVGSRSVFGGQVLAQALNAAEKTVGVDRPCHSFHCYFLLRGDLEKPIHYKVQKVRDGGSFTTRYVTAEQDDQIIFVMAASFQIEEEGFEFQEKMPEAPDVDSLFSWEEIYEQTKDFLPENMTRFLGLERPITFKPAVIHNPMDRKNLGPTQSVWFKFKEASADMSYKHFQQILAYASDYNVLMTALQPHASEANFNNMLMASIDHAMWFHRKPDDFTDWFLYHIDVDSNSNARGLTTGKIFSKDGKLIATVAQEGLMRRLK